MDMVREQVQSYSGTVMEALRESSVAMESAMAVISFESASKLTKPVLKAVSRQKAELKQRLRGEIESLEWESARIRR